MEKFTPGPWRMIGKIKGNRLFGRIFAKDPTSTSDRDLVISAIEETHPDKQHLERLLADFKLQSHAPEMYDLLKGITEGNFPDHEVVQELLSRINQ